jgi:anti-sigma factor (TIGR02949 family)
MKKDCNHYSPFISGFIDGELKPSERYEVKAHLDDCPNCNKQYLNEKKLKKLVKERVPTVKAPNYLHRRIRRQLVRKGDRPRFWELVHSLFVYRPLAASVALALVAFLVVYPTFQMGGNPFGRSSEDRESAETVEDVELQGQIVCLDCEFLSLSHEKGSHDATMHRLGLRSKDGTIWSFVHTNTTHDLLFNESFIRKNVSVSGKLFNKSRYIYVKNYKLL